MKKQTLAIITILSIGSLFGIGYATSTVISPSGITTPSVTTTTLSTNSLTVTGACTGCGAGEGSFSSYSLLTNTTLSVGVGEINSFQTDNNGSAVLDYLFNAQYGKHVIINKLGSVVTNIFMDTTPSSTNVLLGESQSLAGLYRVLDGNQTLHFYKNNTNISNLGINQAQLFTHDTGFGVIQNLCDVSMSPSGKYVDYVCTDDTTTQFKFFVFRGT